ncbi:restriction endonuclease subunit S [Shewanella baltica]|uniref:restriction endonuclease subunit S n=1 Tax=Shewanella baltica TaxID=62322 RepID=UPI003D7A47D4
MRHLRKVKIKDLGKVFTGSTPSTKDETMWDGEYPFVKPSDLINGSRRVFSTETKLSHKATKTSKGRLLPAGTTCIVTIGTIGKLCQLDRPAATNQQINSIVVDRTNYDEDYVYYLMSQSIDRVKVVEGGSASGREHVKKSTFEEIEIEVLPFSDQIKVSNLVARYDNLIENNNRRIAILEEMAQSLYREWFVNFRYPGHANQPDGSSDNKDSKQNLIDSPLGPIPEGWEVKRLDEVAQVNPQSIASKNAPKSIGYIDIKSVGSGIINEVKSMSFKDAPSRAKRIVIDGDIIWATVRPNRKQFSYICKPNTNTVASTGFAVLRSTKVPSSYLYSFTTTDLFTSYLVNHATGSAYPAVNADIFSKANVLVPPNELLEKFDDLCQVTMKQSEVLKKKNENLKKQRDMLLPKLISGQIQLKD